MVGAYEESYVFNYDGIAWVPAGYIGPQGGQVSVSGDAAVVNDYIFQFDGNSWAFVGLAYGGARGLIHNGRIVMSSWPTVVTTYVFDGNDWNQETTLSGPMYISGEGWGLGLDDSKIIFGTISYWKPQPGEQLGNAHVFHLDHEKGWIEQVVLHPHPEAPAAYFGIAADVNDQWAVVGARLSSYDDPEIPPTGSAYAFPLISPDCNCNGIADACEGNDCNFNGILDECEDCNENGTPDVDDIAAETSLDCDANCVPDECQPDCNGNSIADVCDTRDGNSEDCNANGIPDECEPDGNGDGVPDSCTFVSSFPPHNTQLWRQFRNRIRLTFAGPVNQVFAGFIQIRELLPDGALGGDLSDNFGVFVDGTDVVMVDTDSVLENRKWYRVTFTKPGQTKPTTSIDLFVQAGDANNDGFVNFADILFTSNRVPTLPKDLDESTMRGDINADTLVNFADMSHVIGFIPALRVPKPTGH